MPVHVPPISRRQFLAAAAATGAGLVFSQRSWAADDRADPDRWVLLADTHLQEDAERRHNEIHPVGNYRQARAEFLSLEPRPAGVITAGDVAFLEGLPGDYRTVVSELAPIRQAGIPVHMSLGNHDHRENFWTALPAARPAGSPSVADKHVSIIESPRANWFLLDSLEKTNYTPGTLGNEQLGWLATALDARADKPALVVMHHNPDPTPNTSGLRDTAQLLDLLAPRKQVKALFYGHSHRWNMEQVEGIHLVNLPTLVWVFDQKQPRGWVDARLNDDRVTLHFNALDRQHVAHGQTADLTWRA